MLFMCQTRQQRFDEFLFEWFLDNVNFLKIGISEIDNNDVHFVCILADDEIEITSYLFDVLFRAKIQTSQSVHIPDPLLALRAVYSDKKVPSA